MGGGNFRKKRTLSSGRDRKARPRKRKGENGYRVSRTAAMRVICGVNRILK